MESNPNNVPQSVINEYNERLNKEIARLNEYKKSLQEEYEQRVIDEKDVRYQAMRSFSDNVGAVADRICEIALDRDTDRVSPATALKAATYIYDRVIGDSDAPEKDDMELLLEKLRTPVSAEAESSDTPVSDELAFYAEEEQETEASKPKPIRRRKPKS